MGCQGLAWFLLTVLDCLLILVLFFPLAVLHWRGTWGLLDIVVESDMKYRIDIYSDKLVSGMDTNTGT